VKICENRKMLVTETQMLVTQTQMLVTQTQMLVTENKCFFSWYFLKKYAGGFVLVSFVKRFCKKVFCLNVWKYVKIEKC
jgi:hypothetical protein